MRNTLITIGLIALAAYIFKTDILKLLMGEEGYNEHMNAIQERQRQRANDAQLKADLARSEIHDLTGYEQAEEREPGSVQFYQTPPNTEVYRTDPVIQDQDVIEVDRAPFEEAGECIVCDDDDAFQDRISQTYGPPTTFI